MVFDPYLILDIESTGLGRYWNPVRKRGQRPIPLRYPVGIHAIALGKAEQLGVPLSVQKFIAKPGSDVQWEAGAISIAGGKKKLFEGFAAAQKTQPFGIEERSVLAEFINQVKRSRVQTIVGYNIGFFGQKTGQTPNLVGLDLPLIEQRAKALGLLPELREAFKGKKIVDIAREVEKGLETAIGGLRWKTGQKHIWYPKPGGWHTGWSLSAVAAGFGDPDFWKRAHDPVADVLKTGELYELFISNELQRRFALAVTDPHNPEAFDILRWAAEVNREQAEKLAQGIRKEWLPIKPPEWFIRERYLAGGFVPEEFRIPALAAQAARKARFIKHPELVRLGLIGLGGITFVGLASYLIENKQQKKKIQKTSEAQTRFQWYEEALEKYGTKAGTTHKRIIIPKSEFTEEQLTEELGFKPVTIAIPEAGQETSISYRHPDIPYHIHSFEDVWTMHRDVHQAATMMPWYKAVLGLPHTILEGIPGAYYYLKGKLTNTKSMRERLVEELPTAYLRRIPGFDDEYNTIEGMPHGWFGKQRKKNTDFGSGFTGTFKVSMIPEVKHAFVGIGFSAGLGLGAGIVDKSLGTGFDTFTMGFGGFSLGYTRGGLRGGIIGGILGGIWGGTVHHFASKFGWLGSGLAIGISGSVGGSLAAAGLMRGGSIFNLQMAQIKASAGKYAPEFLKKMEEAGFYSSGPAGFATLPTKVIKAASSFGGKGLVRFNKWLDTHPFAGRLLDATFSSPSLVKAAEEAGGIELVSPINLGRAIGQDIIEGLPLGVGTSVLSGGIGVAFSGKDDTYNTIEGLPHEGIAGQSRKKNTDFGSGLTGTFKVPMTILHNVFGLKTPALLTTFSSNLEESIRYTAKARGKSAGSMIKEMKSKKSGQALLGQLKYVNSLILEAKRHGHSTITLVPEEVAEQAKNMFIFRKLLGSIDNPKRFMQHILELRGNKPFRLIDFPPSKQSIEGAISRAKKLRLLHRFEKMSPERATRLVARVSSILMKKAGLPAFSSNEILDIFNRVRPILLEGLKKTFDLRPHFYHEKVHRLIKESGLSSHLMTFQYRKFEGNQITRNFYNKSKRSFEEFLAFSAQQARSPQSPNLFFDQLKLAVDGLPEKTKRKLNDLLQKLKDISQFTPEKWIKLIKEFEETGSAVASSDVETGINILQELGIMTRERKLIKYKTAKLRMAQAQLSTLANTQSAGKYGAKGHTRY